MIRLSDVDLKKKPVLILRNPDGAPIGVLGGAYHVEIDLHYNEISTLTFSLSAFDAGIPTPCYDQVVGLRMVELKGIGFFILNNPKTENAGVWEVKTCSAYSLEREFTNKNVYFEKNVYNFYDPVRPEGTVLGILLEKFPAWSVGTVDRAMAGTYRSLDDLDENAYHIMKSTLQEAYGCIFDFDTYKRKVNVRAASNSPAVLPAVLTLDHLVKKLEIEEDDESIATRLSVSGADGLDIRSVNPMGDNCLYDLSYWMRDETYFDRTFLQKYQAWRDHVDAQKEPFYHLSVEQALKTARVLSEQAVLAGLEEERKALEGVQASYVEMLASHDYGEYSERDEEEVQKKLDQANRDIAAKTEEISAQQAAVDRTQAEADALQAQRKNIVDGCQMSAFFTPDERERLDFYIRENTLEESSFVVSNVKSYNTEDTSVVVRNLSAALYGQYTDSASMTSVHRTGSTIYTAKGGRLELSGSGTKWSADVIRASVEVLDDRSFTMSAYLSSGTGDGTPFQSGTLVLTGTCESSAEENGTSFVLSSQQARLYFTQNVTEWERRSVAWDLMKFGEEALQKLCQPSFSFRVSSADFLVMDEFAAFKNALTMGQRIYLKMPDGKVLEPVLIGLKHVFDESSELELEFSSKYSASDQSFQLTDLLEKSISMGSRMDLSRNTYSAYLDSHANVAFDEFYNGALDVSKNMVMSSVNQAVSWDQNGIRLRKWADDAHTAYDPHQIWMMNENICFTEDGWQTAKMAIGHIVDPQFATDGNQTGDLWGVVAPNLIGEAVIGKRLAFYCPDEVGGAMQFRFDSAGIYSYNAHQYWRGKSGGFALLDPDYGFMLGVDGGTNSPVIVGDDGRLKPRCIDDSGALIMENMGPSSSQKIPKGMNLYMDVNGHVYLRGTVFAKDGEFSGVVKADDFLLRDGSGYTSILEGTKIKSKYLDLGNIKLDGKTGNISLTGNITWDANSFPIKSQFAVTASGSWHDTMELSDLWRRDRDSAGNWGSPYQFRGSDASVTRDNMVLAMLQSKDKDGLYSYRDPSDGKNYLGVNATAIKTGVLSAINIEGCHIKAGSDINVNDKFVVDSSGNVHMKGNITWGSGAFPIQSQFAATSSGSWHDTMQDSDRWRRDKLYNGTFGTPYQFRGQDGAPGRNGSDANVTFHNILSALQSAAATKETFITADALGSPSIFGAKIYGAEIYAGGNGRDGGQIIGLTDRGIKIYDGYGHAVLTLKSDTNDDALIHTDLNALDISTAYLILNGSNQITFKANTVDFTGVSKLKGLYATFK